MDKNNFSNGLYLSVNRHGLVSLWDTERDAMNGKENGEIYLTLQLTPEQQVILESATRRAR